MAEEERFLIDGSYLTGAECLRVFSESSTGEREKKCLNLVEGYTIVDIGCYAGRCVSTLKRRYPEKLITGMDYFNDHLRVAQLLHPHLKGSFLQMSVYNMGFASESIDCALCQEVIEHLEAAGSAVKEINRVLKKGGALIISTNNPYFWRDLLGFLRSEIANLIKRILGRGSSLGTVVFYGNVEWNRHIASYTPSTLMTLLEVNGFEYVEHRYGSGNGRLDRLMDLLFPFLGSTQIIKVRKVRDAPAKLV